ncbi:MAG: hypothetical protein DMG53_29525 [Acidobacteria bacterium]|nr:MAG: hypothetical protein DMG53_29525 [Acidobacteriota bacterium]
MAGKIIIRQPQAEYLYECVAETIEKDLREEIGFIQKHDRALDETKEIVDMPDKRASLLVRLIMQNKGRLAKNKRDMFSEVTDEELARIERAMQPVHIGQVDPRTPKLFHQTLSRGHG